MVVISALTSFFGYQVYKFKSRKRRYVPQPKALLKRAERYPEPFPNGWINICASKEIKNGQVKEVEAFGQKLAVFRGEDGKVGVFDVYCPHLQANLADGKVVGNHLVCPFHAWEFNHTGKCQRIPYSEGVPSHAKANAWTVRECWGLILVWYHKNDETPNWLPDKYLPELSEYKYHGKKTDLLHIHLQDFAENGADYAHFKYVHDLLTIPFSNRFVALKHSLEIQFGEGEESHLAWFTDKAQLVWKKSQKVIKQGGGEALVTYFGPGFLVFRFTSRIAKDVILLKSFTPLGPLRLRMDDYIYAPKGTNRLAIKYILREAAAQFKDDIMIWEKKGYSEKPLLVKGDGPIMQMRKWYQQFYS
ncbi:MAG: Rieske 2Fe-2S domain-containing protein [Chitinophagales bacterium]